ncbi:unnamed protein product, partial [marine sediment metagenome]
MKSLMKRFIARLLFALLVATIVLYAVFPFYFAIVSSLKSGTDLFRVDYWPVAAKTSNYARIFVEQPFGRNIFNSFVVALSVVALGLLLGITAAYALARVHFRGRKLLLLTILAVSMFPQVAVLSGMFELIRSLGLYNHPLSLVLSYMIFILPFTVWVLAVFMRGLPRDLEDAAAMDGARPWVIVTRIFMPMMWPVMASTGMLAFIAAWNEFLFA